MSARDGAAGAKGGSAARIVSVPDPLGPFVQPLRPNLVFEASPFHLYTRLLISSLSNLLFELRNGGSFEQIITQNRQGARTREEGNELINIVYV